VVDVTTDNVDRELPEIMDAIDKADIVALDCELSGLGDRKKLRASDMEDRYNNMCRVAMTRSIISLGISVFRQHSDGDDGKTTSNGTESDEIVEKGDPPDPTSDGSCFSCCTWNVMVLCGDDYIVEPGSLKFLVLHGFDFGKQYSKGIPYYRGNDRPDQSRSPVREIFNQLVRCGKPLVLHNGHVDLMFLYQNFYAQLPASMNSFVADLNQMFAGGIFDTKYAADYVIRMTSSYLEYAFKTLQVRNHDRATNKRPHLRLRFPHAARGKKDNPESLEEQSDGVEFRNCRLRLDPEATDQDIKPCETYSSHGHCPIGVSCPESHDIDVIIGQKEARKRKRKRTPSTSKSETSSEIEGTNSGHQVEKEASLKVDRKSDPSKSSTSGGHRAGFDAFMTGYSLLSHLIHSTKKTELHQLLSTTNNSSFKELRNKVHLVYKQSPLVIYKSNFSKVSQAHADKFKAITDAGDTSLVDTNT